MRRFVWLHWAFLQILIFISLLYGNHILGGICSKDIPPHSLEKVYSVCNFSGVCQHIIPKKMRNFCTKQHWVEPGTFSDWGSLGTPVVLTRAHLTILQHKFSSQLSNISWQLQISDTMPFSATVGYDYYTLVCRKCHPERPLSTGVIMHHLLHEILKQLNVEFKLKSPWDFSIFSGWMASRNCNVRKWKTSFLAIAMHGSENTSHCSCLFFHLFESKGSKIWIWAKSPVEISSALRWHCWDEESEESS